MEQTEILDTLWEQLYAEAKIREQGSRESCYFQQWMCNMENLLMDALSGTAGSGAGDRRGYSATLRTQDSILLPAGVL